MSSTFIDRRVVSALRAEAEAVPISEGWDQIQKRIRWRPYRRASALAVALALFAAGSFVGARLWRNTTDVNLIGPNPPSEQDRVPDREGFGREGLGIPRERSALVDPADGQSEAGREPRGVTRQSASVAPGGDRLAYMDIDADGNWSIFVRRVGSAKGRNLTPSAGEDGDPAWSPDGHKIAFMTADRRGHEHMQIYVMNADGSNQRRLTHTDCDATPMCRDSHPTWSPDGSRIAFHRSQMDAEPVRGGGATVKEYSAQIWIMNVDGTDARFVAQGYWPEWSPDGKRIAYFSGVASTNPCTVVARCEGRLYLMDPDGTDVRPVGVTGTFAVSWWPDSSKLAFTHQETKTSPFRIWTIAPDGTGLTALTRTNTGYGDIQPTVSPDGRRVVYVRCETSRCKLYILDSDGSNLARLSGSFSGNEQLRPEFAPRSR